MSVCNESELRSALVRGGVVQFGCDVTIPLASSLVISVNTVLDANGRAVTLDGQHSVGVFVVPVNVQFALIGVRVTGGRAVQGGGLYSTGGQVALRDCTFTANAAWGNRDTGVSAMGGAITCVGGGITATNVQFIGNTAASGTNSVITSNSVIASGGAVGLVNSSGLFQSCIFEGNLAHGSDYQIYPLALASFARGGAVASLGGGQFELRSCTFSENQALGGQGFRADATKGTGGAVYCEGPINAENCTFISNAAAAGNEGFHDQDGAGGAIYTAGGGNLENSLFSLNRAVSGASAPGAGEYRNGDAMGGAVFNDGNLAITGCAFASNRVETPLSIEVSLGVNYGGALYSAGDCSIINSTFIQNVAAPQRLANLPTDLFGVAYGAAIYQSNNRVTLTHCTIVSNLTPCMTLSSCVGGTVQTTSASMATLSASIFAGNTGLDIFGPTIQDQGGNFASDPSGVFVNPNSHTNMDLHLGDFGDHGGPTPTIALLPSSPAIDAVDPTVLVDQRGVPRPIGARADAGAFEFTPLPSIYPNHDGGWNLVYVMQPGRNYRVERSSDLGNWTMLWTTNSDSLGFVRVTDSPPVAEPHRFYRVIASTVYTVSVSASPLVAGGSVSGGGTFAAGSSVTVTAAANEGYQFTNWTENGGVVSLSPNYIFTLNANRTFVANFTPTVQCATRDVAFWSSHVVTSPLQTSCVILSNVFNLTPGGLMDLGFIQVDLGGALGIFWGNPSGTSGQGSADDVCIARKALAKELIAAIANVTLLNPDSSGCGVQDSQTGEFTLIATLIAEAQNATQAEPNLLDCSTPANKGAWVQEMNNFTALLNLFNGGGLSLPLPGSLVDCGIGVANANYITTHQVDPTTQSNCTCMQQLVP